ncbi:hypothetical protein EIP86_009674, partial [Pleurotus ostreatoroseus]
TPQASTTSSVTHTHEHGRMGELATQPYDCANCVASLDDPPMDSVNVGEFRALLGNDSSSESRRQASSRLQKSNVNKPAKATQTKKRRDEITGPRFLYTTCNDGEHVIRLGRNLREDLRTLTDSTARDFFQGHGEKVSFVIHFDRRDNFTTQRRCRYTEKGTGAKHYLTLKEIVCAVAQVTNKFLNSHPDFHTDPAFKEWSAGSTIDNFALVGLRKISRASVQIMFQHCASPFTPVANTPL